MSNSFSNAWPLDLRGCHCVVVHSIQWSLSNLGHSTERRAQNWLTSNACATAIQPPYSPNGIVHMAPDSDPGCWSVMTIAVYEIRNPLRQRSNGFWCWVCGAGTVLLEYQTSSGRPLDDRKQMLIQQNTAIIRSIHFASRSINTNSLVPGLDTATEVITDSQTPTSSYHIIIW